MMLPTARAALAAPAAAATSPYVATRPGGIRRTAVSTFWRKAPEVIQHPPRTGKATEEGDRRRPQKNTEEHRFGSGSSRRDVHDLNQCLSVFICGVQPCLSVALICGDPLPSTAQKRNRSPAAICAPPASRRMVRSPARSLALPCVYCTSPPAPIRAENIQNRSAPALKPIAVFEAFVFDAPVNTAVSYGN